MKKIVVFIIIFAIIAITATSTLIHIKNTPKGDVILQESNESENSSASKAEEKTLDLYGMHDENDLMIEETLIGINGNEIKVPKISGLKDKKVEAKINEQIKQKIFAKYETLQADKSLKELHMQYEDYERANFANVISLHFYYSYEDLSDNYHYNTFGLNYELISGEELKVEDLFKKDEDIGVFARIGMYKNLAHMENGFYYDTWYDEIHYDKEANAWMAILHKSWYDEEKEQYEETKELVEYVPPMTDYEIEKKVKKFLRAEKKEFAFTSSKLEMNVDGTNCTIYFSDIPDKIVIYDKYLTKDSLYENNNIGRKNIINCSNERNTGKYKETKYVSNNFFYDIDALADGWSNNDDHQNFITLKAKEEIQKQKEKLQEYEKLAKENPEKAFFVFMESTISNGGDYNNGNLTYNSLYTIESGMKVAICPINDRKKVLDEILSKYRYYNLGFYRTIFEYLWIPEDDANWQTNSEKHVYNMLTGKEITSVADLFMSGTDYESIIKSHMSRDLGSNLIFEFGTEDITVRSADENNHAMEFIPFRDLQEYLVVKTITPNILSDSSVRKYQQEELVYYTKDQLNIAYNELFARHGHDFKSKSLKEYFSFWDWYTPILGKTVSLEELNEIEKYNASVIKEVIDRLP